MGGWLFALGGRCVMGVGPAIGGLRSKASWCVIEAESEAWSQKSGEKMGRPFFIWLRRREGLFAVSY